MRVLTYLADHAGEVATRDALMAEVWSGVVVSDKAVASAITALRKAFDATMKDPKFVTAAKKRKMALAPLSGAAVKKMVLEHLATPADVVKMAKKAAGMK